jgi:hypothetical protein
VDAELSEDVREMKPDRPLVDCDLGGDLFVAESSWEQPENLLFTGGEGLPVSFAGWRNHSPVLHQPLQNGPVHPKAALPYRLDSSG